MFRRDVASQALHYASSLEPSNAALRATEYADALLAELAKPKEPQP